MQNDFSLNIDIKIDSIHMSVQKMIFLIININTKKKTQLTLMAQLTYKINLKMIFLILLIAQDKTTKFL